MQTPLLAVPNVSEGRDPAVIVAIGEAFVTAGARLLDVHSDADHHRSVYTLAGRPGELAQALLTGIARAVQLVDIGDGRGQHPHVGAVDVAPIVHLDRADRGAACAEALLLADLLGQRLELPVLLYGDLAGGRTRAELRRGGALVLAQRMVAGELRPDFGPRRLHRSAGATLVTARPPLVAFNLELAPPAGVAQAQAIAARVRAGGSDGLPGLRAIGIELTGGRGVEIEGVTDAVPSAASRGQVGESPRTPVGQVSMNVEEPLALPLRDVVAAVAAVAAAQGTRIAAAELVGLAPRAALADFPADVPLRGFDPAAQVLEDALARIA